MDGYIANIQISKELVHEIIDRAMDMKDRYITIFSGEYGTSINIYPCSENDSTFD